LYVFPRAFVTSVSKNFFELQTLVPDQNGAFKTNFRSSWVTDFNISEQVVQRLVSAARCRWKIENECFNNLKNQGYHLEHNFGHGKQFLSFNFYLLTLLAFFAHQVFELTDKTFIACRQKFGSKQHLWEKLPTAIEWFIFASWQDLLNFVLARDHSRFQFVDQSLTLDGRKIKIHTEKNAGIQNCWTLLLLFGL